MHVAVRLIEAAFVALLCVALPALALASRRRFDEGRIPSGRRLLVQVCAQLLVLGGLAVAVAIVSGRPLLGAASWTAGTWAACGAFLLLTLGTLPWRWSRATPQDRERLRRLLPKDRDDAAIWTLTCVTAGWAEELAYRGVLTAILFDWSGSSALAAIASAAAFALAHAVQGPRSVLVVFAFALGFQALCVLSGSLLPAMIVHALYDLIAGAAFARLAARERERAAGAATSLPPS